jgi:hypothetical protein
VNNALTGLLFILPDSKPNRELQRLFRIKGIQI